MSVQLNHTIVKSRNRAESATFLAELFGLEAPRPFGHFLAVAFDNGVTLDFDEADEVRAQHYAFLVDEDAFDEIFARINERDIAYFADPTHREASTCNHRNGGRGCYFSGPEGHNYEIFTRP